MTAMALMANVRHTHTHTTIIYMGFGHVAEIGLKFTPSHTRTQVQTSTERQHVHDLWSHCS